MPLYDTDKVRKQAQTHAELQLRFMLSAQMALITDEARSVIITHLVEIYEHGFARGFETGQIHEKDVHYEFSVRVKKAFNILKDALHSMRHALNHDMDILAAQVAKREEQEEQKNEDYTERQHQSVESNS